MASSGVMAGALAISIVATAIGLLSFVRGVVAMVHSLKNGEADHTRSKPFWKRFWNMAWTVISHRMFRGRPVVRAAHWLVMVAFVVLFFTLITSYIQICKPYPVPGMGYVSIWNWIIEFFAVASTIAIIALMVVRSIAGRRRTSRFYGSTNWQGRFVEWIILLVCLCVLVIHGLDYAYAVNTHSAATFAVPVSYSYPFTAPLGKIFTGLSLTAILNGITIASATKIVISMSWMVVIGTQITMGVSWHRFLAIFNIFAAREDDGTKALGPLTPVIVNGDPVHDFEEIPDDVTFGLSDASSLTWKDRLDLLSCTECGRCQDVCPAWNTQKPLSPKLLTMAMRESTNSADTVEVNTDTTDGPTIEAGISLMPGSSDLRSALTASDIEVAPGESQFVPEVLGDQMIWDCTMCGACVEQCPVDIEHVDRIANLRRYQVLMESAFPRELAKPFKSMQTKGNPYGRPARARLDWAKNLDFSVPVIGEDVEDASEVDYLFWVGCAGAYDDNQKRTTAAVAELLHTAGTTFAVLGSAESCTGDPARRAGNEVLFQLLASTAIETLKDARAQKIVVTCAHCFNTIAREFPELDGHFDVIHHTQLLNRLVREGLLSPVAPERGEDITYHDPCFIGRHNGIFSAPRELLGALPGVELLEMAKNRESADCCGAGGARAWMEEKQGTPISAMRMEQAEATGAKTVATACPFCTQMLKSAPGFGDGPEVKDVAVLLLESVHRGPQGSHPHQ